MSAPSLKRGEFMRRILITIILTSAVLCALAITSEQTQATPALISGTRNYIGVAADTASVTGAKAGATLYATDDLVYYIYNGAAWVLKAGDLGSTVVNVTGAVMFAESLSTNYGIEELGTAWTDSGHVKNGSISGADLRALIRYSGKAWLDTTQTVNGVDTGYRIVNGATVLRGTATVAGLLTPQALNSPVQAILADSTLTAARSGYTYIARPVAAITTATLPENPAVGTNFVFFVADADTLRITTAGSDSLIDGTGAAWKTTTSVAGWIKATLGLVNKWFLTAYNGTWTSY